MLILPPGHYQEVAKPRRPRGRERWVVGIGGALAAVIVVLMLFSLTSHRPKNGNGCVSFTYAMVMGGEEFHACGQKAQDLCTSPPKLTSEGGLANDFKFRLNKACREAKIGPYAAS